MRLDFLLNFITTKAVFGQTDKTVSSLEYDSRNCNENSIFVADSNTSTFIPDAISRGASVILCEIGVPVNESVMTIVVENSRKTLALLAHAWHGFPTRGMRIIGVTGTNGKTTTTFILKALFEATGERVGLIGTTGNYICDEILPTNFTTPEAPELCALFARMKESGISTVVMEVSSHGLTLDRVFGIEFSGAILTNLTQDHLDFHGLMESYVLEKRKLFDNLSASSVAIVNGIEISGNSAINGKKSGFFLKNCHSERQFSFGFHPSDDILVLSQKFSLNLTEFTLKFGEKFPAELRGTLKIATPLVGSFNIENSAAAIGIARTMGISDEQIQSAMRDVRPAPGRMYRIALPNGAIAIVDYAHTPDALEKALDVCRDLLAEIGGGKLAVVFGCGGNRDAGKRPKMGAIAAQIADSVIVTNDNPRHESQLKIITEIMEGVPQERRTQCTVISDRALAISVALGQSSSGDIVLIAGKGHETYQIIGNERIHFDDSEEVGKAVLRMSSE